MMIPQESVSVEISGGHTVFVDSSDLHLITPYSWYLHVTPTKKKYARTTINGKNVSMHRLLLNAKVNEKIDHQDGDGLNNRRSNLRRCSLQQNNRNQCVREHASKFKGVTWRKARQRWVAQIEIGDRKNVYLGSFKTEMEAAASYDEAAKKYFGEFAGLNFS